MLKIILIRHGEEEKEKVNNVEYQTNNSDLTAKGIEQVKKLTTRLLNEFNINKIYSSDIKRALQTTEIINYKLNLNIKIDERLRERNIGDFEGYGDGWRAEFNRLKKEKLAKRIPLKEIRPPKGENLYEFRDRIKSFLINLSKEKGNILVSSHKGVNTAIINFIQNWNCLEFKPIKQDYSCINILSFKNNKWDVLTINNIDHLRQNEI